MSNSLLLADLLKLAAPFEVDSAAAVLGLLRRGDLVATAEIYDLDHVGSMGSVRQSQHGLDQRVSAVIPTAFWVAPGGECLVDWAASNAKSTWDEVDAQSLARFTYTARATQVFVDAERASERWRRLDPSNAVRVGAGGRTPKYDWEGAILELVRLDASGGTVGKSQADLVRHLQDWFVATRTDGDAPAASDIKTRVSRFQRAIG